MIDHDAILITIKVLGSSKRPLTIHELSEKTGLVHRTIQRHISRLRSADMIATPLVAGQKKTKTFYKLKLG